MEQHTFAWEQHYLVKEIMLNKKIQVLEVGNLWFKRFISSSKNDLIVSKFRDYKFEKKENKILVSLMPLSHQVNIIYNDEKNNFISEELKNLIFEDSKYYWCLRLHPLLMHSKYLIKKFESFFYKLFHRKIFF